MSDIDSKLVAGGGGGIDAGDTGDTRVMGKLVTVGHGEEVRQPDVVTTTGDGLRDEIALDDADLDDGDFGSSSSSFLPVEAQDALQIINEEKLFNDQILEYINKTTPSSIGNNYHIVSVFGSQSTGKSTLLNNLFNTNFDVMNDGKRQQTTKGIWMAYSPLISTTNKYSHSSENIFVMDIEGTDGRERGEDQDFERKAALFALSTSEILIVNIWETQIGLYQGANMGLLKTVFEVNLNLFGKNKLTSNDNNHKVLLLFVIRDHVGITPLQALADTLTSDLITMWDNLNKPAELAHFKFDDFFDINFHGLHHKVLQNDKFIQDVAELGDRLVINHELFKPNYHHNIPIDGWTLYAQNCWEQINNNKDLDLPTQQILVAKFKCDEILNEVYNEFTNKFDEILIRFKPDISTDYEDFGHFLSDLTNDILENYDMDASRYDKSVYKQRRQVLQDKIVIKLSELIDLHLDFIIKSKLNQFEIDIKQLKGKKFKHQVDIFCQDLISDFESTAKLINCGIPYESYIVRLNQQILEVVKKQQNYELNNIIDKGCKRLGNGLTKLIQKELENPSEKTWDNVLHKFHEISGQFVQNFMINEDEYDFELGTSKSDNLFAISKYKFQSWVIFYDTIRKLITKENVLTILKERFDDKFRYDEQGLPRLYQNANELEQEFANSKKHALEIVPILTFTKLSNDSEIIPDVDIFDKDLRRKYSDIKDEEDEEDQGQSSEDEDNEGKLENLSSSNFNQILSEQDKSMVLAKFKKQIDAQFIETKRSIIQHITQIPYYIYLIILVLGWNEFMAIIRNPFFFSLLLILATGIYVLYTMNLLKPAMLIVQRLIDECITVGKEKLREFLLDNAATHGDNLKKISKSEEIELQNM